MLYGQCSDRSRKLTHKVTGKQLILTGGEAVAFSILSMCLLRLPGKPALAVVRLIGVVTGSSLKLAHYWYTGLCQKLEVESDKPFVVATKATEFKS